MGICRICLKVGELKSIFEKENQICFSEKIMSCSSVYIHPDDNLPTKICTGCISRLNISYQFKIQCEDSDFKLRKSKLVEQEDDKYDYEADVVYSSLESFDSREKTLNKEERKTSNEIIVENDNNMNRTQISDDYKEQNEINNIIVPDKEAHIFNINEKKPSKGQCSTCGKIMSTRFRLRMHMRTHSGERPHSCMVCGRTFTLAQSLKIHMRTHSGEKPLVCSVCGRTFAQYSGLAAHTRLHTGVLPYHCNICGQNFRTTGHLQYHTRKHTGEKNFECHICHKSFIMRPDLTQHLKIHTGEKRFVCVLCGVRMVRNSHLKRHMATHSKGKEKSSNMTNGNI